MASPNVVEFTTDNWNEHVTSGKLVVAMTSPGLMRRAAAG